MKQKVIICPNEEKERILKKQVGLNSIKYLTIEEFQKNYFFNIDERAIEYLMKKYGYEMDVAKVYLKNLYAIDIEKEYHHKKSKFLQNIKKELIENNLLEENLLFQDFIKNSDIELSYYFELEKYLEELFPKKELIVPEKLDIKVYEYETLEEEISATCIKIRKLIKEGVPLSKIYLSNIGEDDLFLLNKMFSYYQIPINIDFKESIYSTKVVQDYLKTNTLDLEKEENIPINKKIISVLKRILLLEESPIKEKIKIDLLKNTYLNKITYKNAVNIINFQNRKIEDDEYLFILGFNQDILPQMEKDIEYITDSLKEEIPYYKVSEINTRRKQVIKYLFSNIKNLTLSYKKSTPFQSYYPSSLIKEWNLEVIQETIDDFTYSNFYNEIRIKEMRDLYDLYKEKDKNYDLLNNHYEMKKSYSNKFSGLNLDFYQKNLPYPLTLSYTSLNTYNECKFKYYLRYILKLEEFEDTFASFLGSFYHKILSCYKKDNFDIEKEMNEFLKTRELSLKEMILLPKIKQELKELVEIIKKQNLLTGYDLEYHEKKITIPLKKDIAVEFTGTIDKIMMDKKIEDTYFSIVDYKTGSIDTHIEPMKYGLHMQLPIYLYLIHYGNLIKNPIFTGIYYQNILFPYPTWSKTVEEDAKKKYYLNGYTTDKLEQIERFDATYEDSEWIKSLKVKDGKFGTYTKIMDDDTLYHLIQFVKNHIEEKTDEILNGDFKVNPKIYNKKNISCDFCKFRDCCFKKEKDEIYLDKVDDLSFLGGEEE